jgi:serine protease Do
MTALGSAKHAWQDDRRIAIIDTLMPSRRQPASRLPTLAYKVTRKVAAATVLLLLLQSPAGAANGGYAALVRQVAPSVVTVQVQELRQGAGQRAVERATADSPDSSAREFVRRMLSGPDGGDSAPGKSAAVLGSGFIIDAAGLIVTNRHVIVGARSVRVKLADGREVPAQVVGADATTDIALLRVNAGRLPALRLSSSDKLSVGDPVIAIGNPFGLGQSVTAGILSARARVLEQDPLIDFLQTDAAINMGNSGGPLLSADGAVVGVTTAIVSPSGGSVGLGFAIPAETIVSVVAELKAHGRVNRGYLGISVQAMTPALAQALLGSDTPVGALITSVDDKGPAAGELAAGDVLLSIAATPVTFPSLGKIAVRLVPGTTVDTSVMRDGSRLTIAVTVGQLPDPPDNPLQSGGPDTWVPNLDLGVANATSEMRKALKAEDEIGGLIVTQLRHDGVGAVAGLKIGDLITHAGTKRLEDVADLAGVSKPSARLPLLLRVVRGGSPGFIAITGNEDR